LDDPSLSRRDLVGNVTPALGALLMLPDGGAKVPPYTAGNVRRHGAVGDGKAKDTRAIQAAVDACHAAGGGTAYVPPGDYLSGSVHLRTGVCLFLDHGATLRASPDIADFDAYEALAFKNAADRETSFFHQSLLWAEDVERIAIAGTGTIDCNRKRRGGPKAIAFKRCRHVTVSGITIRDCPNYCISLLGTDYVAVEGVTILNGFADGIDPDCCRHVRIANCHIETWDDAIVPKTSFSLGERRSTENVVVTNCVLYSACNAFKLGTESGGDFRNIAFSNCALFARAGSRLPISGISLLSVDGATIEGVAISNVTMTGVRCPIFLRLGNRGRDMDQPRAGTLRDIAISNVIATGARWPSAIVGIPDHPIEGIGLSHVRIACKGGATREEGHLEVPEHVTKYPTADMFTYPAFGFYCRHVRDLNLSDVAVRCDEPDQRPALFCEDVGRLTLDNFDAPPSDEPALMFRDVRGALIRGCMPRERTKTYLRCEGKECRAISLLANDFGNVRTVFEHTAGAPADCVTEVGNRK
jgi:hypothetical protein